MAPTSSTKLHRVQYVAKRLGYNEATVRKWIRAQRLQAIRMPGGTYRVPATELDRLLSPKR